METLTHTVNQLSALAHKVRLAVFRHLMREKGQGVAAGRIAEALGVQPNRLTGHLNILVQSGLVTVTRSGRHMIYRADVDVTSELVRHLVATCCDGNPEVCRTLQDAEAD